MEKILRAIDGEKLTLEKQNEIVDLAMIYIKKNYQERQNKQQEMQEALLILMQGLSNNISKHANSLLQAAKTHIQKNITGKISS